jgi:hypothetical protein
MTLSRRSKPLLLAGIPYDAAAGQGCAAGCARPGLAIAADLFSQRLSPIARGHAPGGRVIIVPRELLVTRAAGGICGHLCAS